MVFITKRLYGIIIFLFAVSLGVLVSKSVALPLYGIFLFIVLVCFSDFLSVPGSYCFNVTRRFEKYLSIGANNPVELVVTSYARRICECEIRDLYPVAFESIDDAIKIMIGAQETVSVRYHMMPLKKGEYTFTGIEIRIIGKWGLIGRQYRYKAPALCRVYPNIMELKKYLRLLSKNQLEESGYKTLRSGGENEFDFLREYLPGDNYRDINWKATAKKMYPITQINRKEIERNVLVLLDAGRMMTTKYGVLTKVDIAIDAALILSAAVVNNNDRFGVLAFDDQVRSYFKPQSTRQIYGKIMSSLYSIEPGFKKSDYLGVHRFVKQNISKNSIIFVFSELYNRVASRELIDMLYLLNKKHTVKLVSFEEYEERVSGNKPEEVTRFALQLSMAAEKKSIIRELQAKGIETLQVDPFTIKKKTVNTYLSI